MLESLNLKDKNVVTGQQTQVGHRRLSAGTQVTSILFLTIMEKNTQEIEKTKTKTEKSMALVGHFLCDLNSCPRDNRKERKYQTKTLFSLHKGSLYTFLFSEGKVGQERESDDISKELST